MVVGAVRGIGRAVKTVQRGRRSVRCEDHVRNRVGTISSIQLFGRCSPEAPVKREPGVQAWMSSPLSADTPGPGSGREWST